MDSPRGRSKSAATVRPLLIQHLSHLIYRQQQTQRTLLYWLGVEYQIAKPSNKLLTPVELDSEAWVGEVKRLRGKKHPLSPAGLQARRDE